MWNMDPREMLSAIANVDESVANSLVVSAAAAVRRYNEDTVEVRRITDDATFVSDIISQ